MSSGVARSRKPLSQVAVSAEVLASSALYTSVAVVASTGSTNADLLAAARAGAAAGSVLVAEEQTAGRGRLDRTWLSEPGTALTFSVLLRPTDVPPAWRGWLPLLTGVATAVALTGHTAVDVSLKWPNDVLAGSGKLAGILAEQAGQAIVVGIGLNVSATRDELPSGQATSLQLAGGRGLDRAAILITILREFERWYLRWTRDPRPGDPVASGLHAAYLSVCTTIGRDVRVELPGSDVLAGRATGVDECGRLLVSAADGVHAVSAGDVVHVR
ncbi:MAG: biotin--[acetyl-CoA-carboxylase] ligase [Actinobacteria bacterium]|nr:biotin--[acetyl-CoA-carboxylase] ligase [Actinomycetota bacterium]MBO0834139.1 biotin--[acetyl-CoA-carboxylase] ligase [Actinomycetota bacterium]